MKNILNKYGAIQLKNESDKILKLNIYGYIGYWDTSANYVLQKIENADADEIHVHINSGGGSAFDGIAICNILKNHKAKVIAHIDGWAASAASIIAMGADEVIMPSNTMMMIHQASTFAYGNADEFEKIVIDLRKIDTAVKASYENRFVGSADELEKLLNDETWLTADEAQTLGFADTISDEIEYDEPVEAEEDEEQTVDDLVAKYSKKQPEAQRKEKQKENTQTETEPKNVGSFNLLKKWR
ncbi:MAG TPA: head maturation protease, ClpP-related [Alloiococcus sp.]|nr:head maturation protease, ClpP-related [Alloiococcus sp.]